jgi:hypothetical protein
MLKWFYNYENITVIFKELNSFWPTQRKWNIKIRVAKNAYKKLRFSRRLSKNFRKRYIWILAMLQGKSKFLRNDNLFAKQKNKKRKLCRYCIVHTKAFFYDSHFWVYVKARCKCVVLKLLVFFRIFVKNLLQTVIYHCFWVFQHWVIKEYGCAKKAAIQHLSVYEIKVADQT